MIKEREYLETEHLLVAVKCEDSDESYGEGCISLMNIFSDKPQRFKCEISHRGAHIGILSGGVHIVGAIGEGRMKKLLMDDDDMGTARGDKMCALYRGKGKGGAGGRVAVLRAHSKLFCPLLFSSSALGIFTIGAAHISTSSSRATSVSGDVSSAADAAARVTATLSKASTLDDESGHLGVVDRLRHDKRASVSGSSLSSLNVARRRNPGASNKFVCVCVHMSMHVSLSSVLSHSKRHSFAPFLVQMGRQRLQLPQTLPQCKQRRTTMPRRSMTTYLGVPSSM